MIRERSFLEGGDRYKFDLELCPASRGWAQWDTTQDASYYGTWVNPFRLTIVNFAEGDVTITRCETEAEFKDEARKLADWARNAQMKPAIDPGFTDRPNGAQIATRLRALGLADLMHASSAKALETG
jgi:hypothetical protein